MVTRDCSLPFASGQGLTSCSLAARYTCGRSSIATLHLASHIDLSLSSALGLLTTTASNYPARANFVDEANHLCKELMLQKSKDASADWRLQTRCLFWCQGERHLQYLFGSDFLSTSLCVWVECEPLMGNLNRHSTHSRSTCESLSREAKQHYCFSPRGGGGGKMSAGFWGHHRSETDWSRT